MAAHWCEKLPEYEVVVESGSRRVVMLAALGKERKKVDHKDAMSIRRWMEIWCRDQADAIPAERFKLQERAQGPKGVSAKISVFKSYQARFYGFSCPIEGKETFLVTAIDADKKSNDADPNMLKRARQEAFRVLQVLNEKK